MNRPRVPCCEPIRKPFPSGVAWAHPRWCREHPGAKIVEPTGLPLRVNGPVVVVDLVTGEVHEEPLDA